MRHKRKEVIFVIQIKEEYLKAIKCLINNSSKPKLLGIGIERVSNDEDEKVLAEKLRQVLKGLDFKNNPLIISLPRNYATCRNLQVPTQVQEEIEKIVSLQAPRFLPYPAEELITGYELISNDADGYSHIKLVIAHNDIIQRYLRILQGLKSSQSVVVLSSFGISNFYNFAGEASLDTVMVIDIDYNNVELAIVSNKKLIFSRYFKLEKQPEWKASFIQELNKTQDAYIKENLLNKLQKIVLLESRKDIYEYRELLRKQFSCPVELISYEEKIAAPAELLNNMLDSNNSFFGLLGLAVGRIEDSLNLLPREIKAKDRNVIVNKERMRIILLTAAIFVIWGLATLKNLENKARYLARLKYKLSEVAKEARPLEEIERAFKLAESQHSKGTLILDILHELYKVLPQEVSLTNFSYEEGDQVILRGQARELSSVFVLVSQLDKSPIFKTFDTKVRYATKRKIQGGEIIDFEIACLNK